MKPVEYSHSTWLSGQRMLRIRSRDVAIFAVLCLIAAGAVATGAMASRQVTPTAARSIATMLRRLEATPDLPNVVLVDENQSWSPLLSLTQRTESVVAFYGAGCEECQKIVPRMVAALGVDGPWLLVVKADEDAGEVRRRLNDLGLRRLRFVIDKKGQLAEGGNVDVLPTVFRVGSHGQVLERIEGTQEYVFERLLRRFGGGVYARVEGGPDGQVRWERR